MHFWWMFFSSSLAKMKWAEVETYMIIFGFVLFSGLARWKIFSIEIMIDIPKGSHQNWPSLDQNWLPKRFGSKLAKSKVAVRENAAGTQSTWVLPSYSSWRYTFPLAKLNLLKLKIHICRIYTLNIWIYSALRCWRGRSLPRGWLRPSHRVSTGLFLSDPSPIIAGLPCLSLGQIPSPVVETLACEDKASATDR